MNRAEEVEGRKGGIVFMVISRCFRGQRYSYCRYCFMKDWITRDRAGLTTQHAIPLYSLSPVKSVCRMV